MKSSRPVTFSHEKKLLAKLNSGGNSELKRVYAKYEEFKDACRTLRIIHRDDVLEFVRLFNEYRGAVAYTLEKREHSGQENLRSSILEEFFQRLFKDEVASLLGGDDPKLVLGKANSYVDLAFTPRSFKELFRKPTFYVHTKDQDFVVGSTVSISMGDSEGKTDVVVPVLAVECKTYIETNMLDSCAGTARRLKSAMPYCQYYVAAEYMKIESARVDLTSIDDVLILCKASNSERAERKQAGKPPHPIDSGVVWSFFEDVDRHLRRIWWDPENALSRGRIIGRP